MLSHTGMIHQSCPDPPASHLLTVYIHRGNVSADRVIRRLLVSIMLLTDTVAKHLRLNLAQ